MSAKKNIKKNNDIIDTETEIDEISDDDNSDILDDESKDEDEDEYEENDIIEYDESSNIIEIIEKDNKADIEETCYYQYDNFIDEQKNLEPASQVLDDNRITLNRLTKFEMVRILGIRTHQISSGAKPFINNINDKSSIEIAILELKNKTTPLKIKRPLPNNTYEVWKISDLNIFINEDEEKSLIKCFS
jgi:DNA-directed RNA polymerase subunit K/omega